MRVLKTLTLATLIAFTSVSLKVQAQNREFYQLKIYTFETEEQVKITEAYLEFAYLPALAKLKMRPVGVFKPRSYETDTLKRIFVLTPFSSLNEFQQLDAELAKDKSYSSTGAPYINAIYDQPPYQRFESIILRAFVDMPKMEPSALDGPRSERLYELRSYESASEAIFQNKVDMFNAGGEVKLFDRLQFNAVFYGEVISGPKMPNLIYMTTFANQESRDKHWQAFGSSPEWNEMKVLDKYQNNVSHIDITFLYPTEYSGY